ncbi:MAG: hypothetical protein ACRDKA_01865 [Actinomycetota bacterium]
MTSRRRVVSLLGVSALLLLSLAGTATAGGKPVKETITFSETFEDEFLSDECGVDVTTSVDGRLTFFTFPDRPVGPQDITSVHVDFLATAGDNTARFKDVGADVLRVEPDGTAVLMIVGQLPFDFTGVLMIDLTTGEAILEPHHFVDTTRVCHLLTK